MRSRYEFVENGVHSVSAGTGHVKITTSLFTDPGTAGPSVFKRRRATCFIAGVVLLAPVSALADIIGESGAAGLGGATGMRGGDGGAGHTAVVITDTTPFENAERLIGGAGGGGGGGGGGGAW